MARSPQEITIGEILRVLEETMAPVLCVAKERKKRYFCPRKKVCLARNLWQKIQDILNSTLDSITLDKLINKKI